MDIRQGRALWLGKAHLGPQQQSAEQKICQRQHHVEIPVQVTVVQEVVAIKPEKESTSLDLSTAGNVHAPMEILVRCIVETGGQERTTYQDDAPAEQSQHDKRDLSDYNQNGPIPPSHWHGLAVMLPVQVVTVVSPENSVMHQSMPLEGIMEYASRPMHYITMERPFETGIKNNAEDEPQQQPKYQRKQLKILKI